MRLGHRSANDEVVGSVAELGSESRVLVKPASRVQWPSGRARLAPSPLSWHKAPRASSGHVVRLSPHPVLFCFASRGRQALRVREHKVLGPYVDGLSRLAVASYKVKLWVTHSSASGLLIFIFYIYRRRSHFLLEVSDSQRCLAAFSPLHFLCCFGLHSSRVQHVKRVFSSNWSRLIAFLLLVLLVYLQNPEGSTSKSY